MLQHSKLLGASLGCLFWRRVVIGRSDVLDSESRLDIQKMMLEMHLSATSPLSEYVGNKVML